MPESRLDDNLQIVDPSAHGEGGWDVGGKRALAEDGATLVPSSCGLLANHKTRRTKRLSGKIRPRPPAYDPTDIHKAEQP